MDSHHQLQQDKRFLNVFKRYVSLSFLTIAAVLSALPLHILIVFSDKSVQSTVGLRGPQCRGGWGLRGSWFKEKGWVVI